MTENFQRQIGYYNNRSRALDIDDLIHECAQHEEVEALHDILIEEESETLTLSGTWSEHAWKTLVKAMSPDFDASKLVLRKLEVDEVGGEQLFELMVAMPALNDVYVYDVEVCEKLPPGLPHGPSLEEPISLHVHGGKGDLCALLIRLMARTKLRKLDCDELGLSFAEQASVVLAIARHPDIESLCWDRIETSELVFEMLVNVCASSTSLTKLSLQRCGLGNPGAESSEEDVSTSEEDVSSGEENIRSHEEEESENPGDLDNPTGGEAPAASLPLVKLMRSSSLRELDLLFNYNLNRRGELASMLNCLGGNTCLRRLELGGVHVNRHCFEALARALKKNSTLTDLSVDGTHSGLPLLLGAVAQNKTLLDFGLFGQFRAADRQQLLDYLVRNRRLLAERLRKPNVSYIAGGLDVILNAGRTEQQLIMPEELARYTAEVLYDTDRNAGKSTALSLAAINKAAWGRAQQVREAWEQKQAQKVQQQKEQQKRSMGGDT